MSHNTRAKNKPAHIIRLGTIKAVVWTNQGARSPVAHSVQLLRIWRDDAGTWHETTSLYRDDLLVAAKVLDLAHTWMHQQGTPNAAITS